jgi:hypothetical protein
VGNELLAKNGGRVLLVGRATTQGHVDDLVESKRKIKNTEGILHV